MAPRLSKRQQREREELEELEALAGPSKLRNDAVLEDESEEEQTSFSGGMPQMTGGFAALAADGEQEGDLESSEEDRSKSVAKSKKSKKKKKKGAAAPARESSPSLQTPSPQTKGGKGKKTKDVPKTKAKKIKDENDFDKALAELSGRFSSPKDPGPATTSVSLSSYDAFNSLLSISLKNLDPEIELRRFFGSRVIGSSAPTQKASRSQASGRWQITRPQSTWPPSHYRAGLSMRVLVPDEVLAKHPYVSPDSRERWWTIEASPRYKGTTYEFMQCVMGGDPQFFFNILREMPWHADTLLQTAEVYRHREEYATAADFQSRTLFSYERAFSAAFNLTTGIHRLDFDRVENRIFYLALSRNVVDLNRRGTPRTAFEFARLLFALDPHTDPHGSLLHLDYLAIKAGQGKWLLDMWDAYNEDASKGETRFDVTMMPGWHWARALALFEMEGDQEHEKSSQALRDAILNFPSVATLIADKADIAMPVELRKMPAFKISTEYNIYQDDLQTSLIHLLSHIFAMRSAPLWKQASRATWLSDTFQSLASQLPDEFDKPMPPARSRLCTLFSTHSNLTDAIYRHVIVVTPLIPEFRRLFTFFPAEVKTRLAQTIEGDPLPPLTAVSAYNDEYFSSVGAEGAGRLGDGLSAELHHLMQEAMDHGRFQALLDEFPEIAAQFPGGVAEFVQVARQFPQQVLDMMAAAVAQWGDQPVFQPGDGMMPGGEARVAENEELGVDGGPAEPRNTHELQDEQDEDDEDDEGDEDEPFLPVRIMRNVLGRFWGRAGQQDPVPEDEDSEEAQPGAPHEDDVD